MLPTIKEARRNATANLPQPAEKNEPPLEAVARLAARAVVQNRLAARQSLENTFSLAENRLTACLDTKHPREFPLASAKNARIREQTLGPCQRRRPRVCQNHARCRILANNWGWRMGRHSKRWPIQASNVNARSRPSPAGYKPRRFSNSSLIIFSAFTRA